MARHFISHLGRIACLLLGLTLLMPPATAGASEEEFLQWTELRLVSPERDDTGQVVFAARVEGDRWHAVDIEAFGRRYRLDDEQLDRLEGFPLRSIRTTHEGGWVGHGGHTVHFRFHHTGYREDRLTRSEIRISVSREEGLHVGEPRHLGLEAPKAPGDVPGFRPPLEEALEIAQRAVADDERFHSRSLRSVTRARAWRGPREGEPCWRIDWFAGPGPAYFVEVYSDGESRVVVEGR